MNTSELKISLLIYETCNKLGINYTPKNKKCLTLIKDALSIGQIYLQLKIIIGDLEQIEERHKVNGLGELLKDDIKHLEQIDHDLFRLAHKLKAKNG